MISRNFIKNNINMVSIAVYIIVFFGIMYLKPNFLYNKDGSLREFGIGSMKKTIIPAWLLAIVISILSYFFVLYYISAPRFAY